MNAKDDLTKQLLDALAACVMRLEWLNDPRTGNTERVYIKCGRKAMADAKEKGLEPTKPFQ